MMLWLLALTLVQSPQVVIFSETELFKPISGNRFAVSSDGRVFVMGEDFSVTRFDATGKKLGRFGRKGEGPGEFLLPLDMACEGDRIWVFDYMRISVSYFDLDGNFQNQIKLDHRAMLKRVDEGWIHWNIPYGEEQPAVIYLISSDLSHSQTLWEWTPTWISPERVYERGRQLAQYAKNPAGEYNSIAVSPDGRLAYVGHSGPIFKITVLDVARKAVSATIRREIQPLPFNREWGEQQIAANNDLSKGKGPAGLRLDAPEFFPLIRGLSVAPTGQLVISLWTGFPDRIRKFLVMDADGNDADLPYQPENNWRVMAVVDGNAYLSGYDDQSGLGVVIMCPLDKVDAVALAHPIHYEASKELWISIK